MAAADSSIPGSKESVSKSVQQLANYANSEEVPGRFLQENGISGLKDADLMEIPVIDLGVLASPSSGREELGKLHSALGTYGCFMAINHGMTSSFLDEVRLITKQFFALPMEEKQKYSREVGGLEGYGNDTILSEKQALDWTDRLILIAAPEDQRQLKFWPTSPAAFRKILHEYAMKSQMITETILKGMARSLDLEDDSFLAMYGQRANMFARLNYFPACPRPDRVLGLKAHQDGSAITIVLQDKEVEGLQFLKDDQWLRVPIIPDALLVNSGDLAEIMSNGVFKSPIHRVVTNSERERISLAVFCCPDPENDIEPADGLVDEARPRKYKKVKDYVGSYSKYYQPGKKLLDAVRIDKKIGYSRKKNAPLINNSLLGLRPPQSLRTPLIGAIGSVYLSIP